MNIATARGDRITAACHTFNFSGGGEFRRGFGDLDGGGIERFEFERAEGSVPDQGLHAREHGTDILDAARSDVEDHLVIADAVRRDDARGRVRLETLGHDRVDWQHNFSAFGRALVHDLARHRQEIVLA